MAEGRRGGRKAGVPNKFTSAIKAAFETAFRDLQSSVPKRGEPEFRLTAWAKSHPTEFYKMMSRMVPQELSGPGGGPIPLGIEGKVVLYLPDNGRRAGEVLLGEQPRGHDKVAKRRRS